MSGKKMIRSISLAPVRFRMLNIYLKSDKSNEYSTYHFVLHSFFFLIVEDMLKTPCKCDSYIDPEGFGICQKRDRKFNGNYSCYIEHSSSCVDILENPRIIGKYMSAVACEDYNEGS